MMHRTLPLLLLLAASGAAYAGAAPAAFAYDATGMRDPMIKPLFVAATNVTGATAASTRREDIERAVLAARIEGVAISARMRGAIINDRLVREGDALAPGLSIRVLRIEPDRIVFVLDNETYDFYLTPTQEMTAP